MDKRMLSIVSDYSCGIQYGYKIFTENFSLVSTEQIFCLLGGRFCFSTPSPLQNPIKNFFKRIILERKGMSLSLQTLTPTKLHRDEESSDSSDLLLFQSTKELSTSWVLNFLSGIMRRQHSSFGPLHMLLKFQTEEPEAPLNVNCSEAWRKCFQRELRSPSEAK